jgi:hypothetical protein
MTATQATAEVFWTAFRALKKTERSEVLRKLLQDNDMRDDIRYALIIEERKKESRVSLNDYLAQREKKRK